MKQFDRQYRFAAGPPGGEGFEVGETSPSQPTALRINFSVEKADTEAPNTARISLWNLSPESIAILNEEDCFVKLRAGYGTNMPLVLKGTITYIHTVMDFADRETVIEIADGRVELRDTYVALSYSGVVSGKDIIEDTAGQMGIAVTFSYNAEFHDFPNGFSFVGPARVALDKGCDSSGLQWQIQDGVLQVHMTRDTMTREVYLLSADTGLIGIPKKVTYGEDGTEEGIQTGWEVTYLLNGAIGIADYVRLESKIVTGQFRVKSVKLDGDNIQGDWMCTARLMEA